MSNEFVSEPKPAVVAEVLEMEQERQRRVAESLPPVEPSTQSPTEQIINAPTRVKAFGKEYEIRQLSIGQVFQASAHIARMALVFQAWGQMQHLETVQERVAGIMEAIGYSGESFVGLISVAITEPVEWVREQDAMEALDVLAAVVDKNLPLFSPENIERIKGRFAGLQARISELGGGTSTT